MTNMFAPRDKVPGRASEIKKWVAECLMLTEDDLVSLAELTCHEPDCPPVETVVTVHGSEELRRTWKIHKPLAAVSQDDVNAALQQTEK